MHTEVPLERRSTLGRRSSRAHRAPGAMARRLLLLALAADAGLKVEQRPVAWSEVPSFREVEPR